MPTVKLIIQEKHVWVYGRNRRIDALIDQVTMFQPKGFEWSEKYKEGEWDGFVHLYKQKMGTFPIGLLEDVQLMLQIKDIPLETVDHRIFQKFRSVKMAFDVTLRPYQVEAVCRALDMKRCVIQLPCGTGKTICGLSLIASVKSPAVFYVHKKELLYQTKEKMEEMFKTKIGQVGDGKIKLRPITVAMIQTAKRLPKELFTNFSLAIFDECHHLSAETFYDIAKETKAEYIIGLSATIRREDGKEMLIKAGAGPICYSASTTDLIRKGYLATPHIHCMKVKPITFGRRDKWADVYRKAIVNNTDRNNLIAAKAVELSLHGKVYIHVKQIAHGKRLVNIINKKILKGVPDRQAVFLHGKNKTSTRKDTLNDFKTGELRILVSTLLGEGVDVPRMYALVLASGGLSGTFVRQVFGRLLRLSDHGVVHFWDIWDRCKYLLDHWMARVDYYQSEEAFVLDKEIQDIRL
tara:strand:+ start:14985 stop:16376 length:1392 start_codon:yes stop_codon:yes gene_type:complete